MIVGTRLVVCVSNTDLTVLEVLQRRYGGDLREERLRPRNRKRIWQWRLTGSMLQKNFLLDIRLWLRVKFRQCELALRYIDTVVETGRRVSAANHDVRRELLQEFRRINHRGAA
jgi:hypothetical protein